MRKGACDPEPNDVRRTRLAAERTWLARWRTGLASAIAALAVGRLAPELVGGSDLIFGFLGAGYALLSVAIVVAGAVRQLQLRQGMEAGEAKELRGSWIVAFTASAAALAVDTLVFVSLR